MSRPPGQPPPDPQPTDPAPTDPAPTDPAPTAPTTADAAHALGTAKRSPNYGESRYRARPPARPAPPLAVHIELRLVDGPEGRQLRLRQAAAIREALRWFAENRTDNPPPPHTPGTAEKP